MWIQIKNSIALTVRICTSNSCWWLGDIAHEHSIQVLVTERSCENRD